MLIITSIWPTMACLHARQHDSKYMCGYKYIVQLWYCPKKFTICVFTQLNSDSATDDATSNHLDSLQQSQESSSSILTEEALPTPPLPRPDSPIHETTHSDSNMSQLPEVGSIRSLDEFWCTGAFQLLPLICVVCLVFLAFLSLQLLLKDLHAF